MSKEIVKKVNIYAMQSYRKKLLELIQRRGVLQVSQIEKTDDLKWKDTSNAVSKFDRGVSLTQKAIEIVDSYNEDKSSLLDSLKGLNELDMSDFKKFIAVHDKIYNEATNIVNLNNQIEECENEIVRLQTKISALEPWVDLDISMRFKETKSSKAFIGTLPKEITHRELKNILLEKLPQVQSVHSELISKSSEMSCFFVICLKKDSVEVENALRSIGFTYPSSPSKVPPKDYITDLEERIKVQQQNIDERKQKIKSFVNSDEMLKGVSCKRRLEFLVDFYTMRKEKYEVISKVAHTDKTFVVTGFMPEDLIEPISKEIEKKCNAVIEVVELDKNESEPVILSNNGFASPVEGVLEMYSMPSKKDIDPTAIMAVFYYILFGLMLSDLAYGLLMFIGCLVAVTKFPKMEQGLKKTLKMFMYCGVSTAFWGLMFGSFFGDSITVISQTFFGNAVDFPAVWFVPLNDPMKMLIFSFAIGIVHIYAGLFISFYIKVRDGDILGAICDVGLWVALVTSLIVWLLTTEMMGQMAGFVLPLSNVGIAVCQIIAGISALGIIFMNGRSSKNPAKRILKGAYELYNITGYLSDILSYSRLLALGLATSVISSVFNTMAAMGGNNFIGIIIFIVVFVFGHLFNLGINLLGSYVHTNRLQYVEFFGKFYEGGGEKFKPFSLHTKYYNIREDNKNG